jgi:hypothetical protein
MHIHLDDPALLASLLSFLRMHDCIVDQIAAGTLAVWCPPGERNGDGSREIEVTCRSCGTPVAETLRRLGSLRCHDCRDESGHETLLAGVYGHANGNGRAANARDNLAGYLAAWQAVNPGVAASVMD